MIQEIALDKARIVQHAATEWAALSTNWLQIIDRRDLPWQDLDDLVLAWLGKRLSKAMGMTEAELTRAVKQYLNTWARDVLRRGDKVDDPSPAVPEPIVWDGMVEDLVQADNMARRKAGKKNLTPWIAPRGQVTVAGEIVDFTSHEFWSDTYLYAIENPLREGESRTAFRRRMGDAGANAKYASERMPQSHNGIKRSYSLSASSDQAVAALADGSFDRQYQTLNRPIGSDRRPMDLRDEPWETYPVTVSKTDPSDVALRREIGRKRFATEPVRS